MGTWTTETADAVIAHIMTETRRHKRMPTKSEALLALDVLDWLVADGDPVAPDLRERMYTFFSEQGVL